MPKVPWLESGPERSCPRGTGPPLVPFPESHPLYPTEPRGVKFKETGKSPEQIYFPLISFVENITVRSSQLSPKDQKVTAVVSNSSETSRKLPVFRERIIF